MENEVKIFENEEFGKVRIIRINENPYFCASDIAKALGYNNPRDAVIRHCRCVVKHDIPVQKGNIMPVSFIPEGDVYRLIMKSKLPSAENFEKWVMDEVLPTIRKTGGYINNEELFINTYLPFADEQTKLLFGTTLETVRKQNEIIKKQQEEIVQKQGVIEQKQEIIEHKQEVINGFTDDIDVYTKKDIINRICKRKHNNYASRYRELYKCFKETFHIDLEARCEGYNMKQIKIKDKLSVIKYAEQFGYIDNLYSCCVKLYETEVKEILNHLNELQN